MKKLFAIVMALFVFTAAVFANVNEQLVFSFNKSFPAAQNAKWSEDANGYFVSFTQYGILSKVAYNIDGDFLYALRYYSEENLPGSILTRVKEKFPNKKIFSVTEVSTADDINYHIKLEDAKKWYGIMVTPSRTITMEERFERNDL
jgi:hypothetical protein